ncbi:MAG: hypothetical protein DI549_20230 [Ancylobacter novellus]|uniref:Uncharacterized protein n=1 Tax=Ancylobacter novellus TaxID=921 RepID=A0A2W5QWR7_ANCNO|nr:MAG: hypothetical protein DI549_20230 [Ancylobacter novellus]
MVRTATGEVAVVNGTGPTPRAIGRAANDGGGSVTVPGIVDAWARMSRRWGACRSIA